MRFGVVAALLFGLLPLECVSSVALAQGVTLNIIHDKSQGTVRINGVPVHYFASKPPFETAASNAFNIGFWADNGDNEVAVEAEPVPGQGGASTKVLLVDEPGDPPLFEQVIDGKGSVSHKVPLEGLPPWSWSEAEAFTGPDSELLAAVAALHKAHIAQDVDAILGLSAAAVDDMTQIAGPMPPEARAEMVAMLKTGNLAPLPGSLKVERYLDNRLIVVTAEGGRAPIELRSDSMPDMPMETGRYWVRRNGKWSVARW